MWIELVGLLDHPTHGILASNMLSTHLTSTIPISTPRVESHFIMLSLHVPDTLHCCIPAPAIFSNDRIPNALYSSMQRVLPSKLFEYQNASKYDGGVGIHGSGRNCGNGRGSKCRRTSRGKVKCRDRDDVFDYWKILSKYNVDCGSHSFINVMKSNAKSLTQPEKLLTANGTIVSTYSVG